MIWKYLIQQYKSHLSIRIQLKRGLNAKSLYLKTFVLLKAKCHNMEQQHAPNMICLSVTVEFKYKEQGQGQ